MTIRIGINGFGRIGRSPSGASLAMTALSSPTSTT